MNEKQRETRRGYRSKGLCCVGYHTIEELENHQRLARSRVENERLMITGTRTKAQSFKKEDGIGSGSYYFLGNEFKRSDTSASELEERIGNHHYRHAGFSKA